jgi:hypothetical protein
VTTFGVRLSDEASAALKQEALRRGMKPTTAAREIIIETLAGANTRTSEARLEAIEAALARLGRELPEALALAVAHVATGTSDERSPGSERRASTQAGSLEAWARAS